MSESTEEIRANIEHTRSELGGDVDALADKVTPSKIVERQTSKLRGAYASVRDSVMGAADDAGSSLGSAGGSAAHDLRHGAENVKARAEGNPLAVGLIAFGVGLLAASLLPASSAERKGAQTAREKAQPLVDEAKEAAREMGANLKEPAEQAASSVRESASEAAEHVRDDATQSADRVSGSVNDARENLSGS
ncbi:MAG TPA: hypothetical protein DCR63_03850 [Microbacterium sp.]|nr:hypothetical protein [Microbacterium sp.]